MDACFDRTSDSESGEEDVALRLLRLWAHKRCVDESLHSGERVTADELRASYGWLPPPNALACNDECDASESAILAAATDAALADTELDCESIASSQWDGPARAREPASMEECGDVAFTLDSTSSESAHDDGEDTEVARQTAPAPPRACGQDGSGSESSATNSNNGSRRTSERNDVRQQHALPVFA